MSSKVVDSAGREIGQREVFHFVGRKAGEVVAERVVTTNRGWALARRDFKAQHNLKDEEVETL